MGRTVVINQKEPLEAILDKTSVCFVSMVQQDGSPYVIPMNFGYTNGIIYLHSANEGKHISILEQNPKVCIVFCTKGELKYQHPDMPCSYSMKSESVLCHGAVEFIEDLTAKAEALNIMMQKYTGRDFVYSRPALLNTKVWQVKVKEMTGKSFGNNFKR